MQDSTVKLADGRSLGFLDLGRADGVPVFFFHGTPGSRLGAAELEPWTEKYGLRVIAADRPGYGLSDPKPGRTLQDWASDVAALADHLGTRRFHVLGESGGGPFALACAAGLGSRVLSATLAASAAPVEMKDFTRGMSAMNRVGFFLARHLPAFLSRMAARKQAQI